MELGNLLNALIQGALFISVFWYFWFRQSDSGLRERTREHLLSTDNGIIMARQRLLRAALVRPYRSGPNKHDRNDADAICEAVRRPQMRYVAVKSVAQQDQLALHRVRAQLLK